MKETKQLKNDLGRIGLFSEPEYISVGEPYVSNKPLTTKGKQFQTSPAKKGKDTNDVYFTPHSRLFENEQYTDLASIRRKERIKAKEKDISKTPFKPTSVPPKPSGKGSNWGTIEQQWPTNNPNLELPLRAAKNEKIEHEPKNFITSPGKKGTGYGYANVTIGKNFTYQSDPYTGPAKEGRSIVDGKQAGARPFISATTHIDFFNPFLGLKRFEAQKPKSAESKLVPFKPSNGTCEYINPYPKYEPPKGKPPVAKKVDKPQSGIFKPSGVTGSYPIRSILESSLSMKPPVWFKQTINSLQSK